MNLTPTAEQTTFSYWLKWFIFLAVMAVLGSVIQKRIFKIGG
jgi:hypothetical protein